MYNKFKSLLIGHCAEFLPLATRQCRCTSNYRASHSRSVCKIHLCPWQRLMSVLLLELSHPVCSHPNCVCVCVCVCVCGRKLNSRKIWQLSIYFILAISLKYNEEHDKNLHAVMLIIIYNIPAKRCLASSYLYLTQVSCYNYSTFCVHKYSILRNIISKSLQCFPRPIWSGAAPLYNIFSLFL